MRPCTSVTTPTTPPSDTRIVAVTAAVSKIQVRGMPALPSISFNTLDGPKVIITRQAHATLVPVMATLNAALTGGDRRWAWIRIVLTRRTATSVNGGT